MENVTFSRKSRRTFGVSLRGTYCPVIAAKHVTPYAFCLWGFFSNLTIFYWTYSALSEELMVTNFTSYQFKSFLLFCVTCFDGKVKSYNTVKQWKIFSLLENTFVIINLCFYMFNLMSGLNFRCWAKFLFVSSPVINLSRNWKLSCWAK